jgi:Domain of unknown function(DUF2779)
VSEPIKSRYLTKTRFKLAVECPTKLFYTAKPSVYADTKQKDDFLRALAEGGFQVGEMAKLMYPGGHDVKALGHDEALAETQALLALGDVTIFEAAIQYGNLFVRVDILRKTGNKVELIEVKAKSFDSTNVRTFGTKDGSIQNGMLPYLQDIAFQRYVLSLAYPQWSIHNYLMMVDKTKTCSVDGLHQKFKINRTSDGHARVTVQPGLTQRDLGAHILKSVCVDEYVHIILNSMVDTPGQSATLAELAQQWAEHYRTDTKIGPFIGAQCAKCEFRADAGQLPLKSGFHECWRQAKGWTDAQIDEGTVLDIWNFKRKQELLDLGVVRRDQVTKQHLKYKEGNNGLTASQRQWMQVHHKWPGDADFYLDKDMMSKAMASWEFPLHFIDFETARVAIPFYSGQRPYANIAFQFSHHELNADGTVVHKNEYLGTTPGMRPNYDFVRKLIKAIGEVGTVFIWSPHENTTLNAILKELESDKNPPADAAEIKAAILELTIVKKGNKVIRAGKRQMVDLCLLAERAFFHPSTNASSSIKKILPAVFQSSVFLRERYSKPIYGAVGGIPSRNFPGQAWWQADGNGAKNPYTLLASVFTDVARDSVDDFDSGEDMEIAEGGAATMAFARLQFDTLSAEERVRIESALLRYCELDTLAMVMIYEAWREWCK